MKIKKKNNKNSMVKCDTNDYVIHRAKLSSDRINIAYSRLKAYLPSFILGMKVTLKDLDCFLVGKYKAIKADWKDVDSCTRTKVKRYNKYCQTVFCASEGRVVDEDYCLAYIIKRENITNLSCEKDEFFYDSFLIIGSEDKKHLTSYFVGGGSVDFAEEIFVLCGNN